MNLKPIKRLLLPFLVGAVAMNSVQELYGQIKRVPGTDKKSETPMISGGAMAARKVKVTVPPEPQGLGKSQSSASNLLSAPGVIGMAFDSRMNMCSNPSVLVPPDPIGAAGPDQLIAVTNVQIERVSKTGAILEGPVRLQNFFADAPAPGTAGTSTFDPKIVYDPHHNRFVVVTLEVVGTALVSPNNFSRILVAVSKTASPTLSPSDWNFLAIDSKMTFVNPNVGGAARDHWADYPGFEVDEEAVYVAANMFPFAAPQIFGGSRLWIIHKGAGAGGFYDGGPTTFTAHDAYAAFPGVAVATTTMPTQIYGAGGVGPGIGTYLVSHSGLSDGVDEFVQIIRVDNPITSPTFSHTFVNVGNIDAVLVGLPDAPQLGTATLIETNDRRALDCVWRNNSLWVVSTILPNSGPNLNQTTAHFWEISTAGDVAGSTLTATLVQQGDIGGEDIGGANTFTYFPAVAVNSIGDVQFGFSASSPTIFAGAFVAGREAGDPLGTVQPAAVVRAGEAPYAAIAGGRNRWGDYSGISIDPANDKVFWVFNEYAGAPADLGGCFSSTWGTAWASCSFPFLIIANEVTISKPVATEGTIKSNGKVIFNEGLPSTHTGDVRAVGNVTIRAKNTINGNVIASGKVLNQGTVNGTITQNAFVPIVPLPALTFSAGSVNVNVSQNRAINLAPGAYGYVTVLKNATLRLRSGIYFLAGLSTGTFSTLSIDVSNGPVTINVRGELKFGQGSQVEITPGGESQSELVTFNSLETGRVRLLEGAKVLGSLIAPEASVMIWSNAGYKGAICAEAVTISQGATVLSHSSLGSLPKTSPVTAGEEDEETQASPPAEFELGQNYPNPFNPSTMINFTVPEAGSVSLQIFTETGQLVRTLVDREMATGRHIMRWNGRDQFGKPVAAGTYFYKLVLQRQTGETAFSATRRMTLLK
jgi:hypothetical protein